MNTIYATEAQVARFGLWFDTFRALWAKVQEHGMQRFASDFLKHDRQDLKRTPRTKRFVWALGNQGTHICYTPAIIGPAAESVASSGGKAWLYLWTGNRLIECQGIADAAARLADGGD